jgi:hypothetical protein
VCSDQLQLPLGHPLVGLGEDRPHPRQHLGLGG